MYAKTVFQKWCSWIHTYLMCLKMDHSLSNLSCSSTNNHWIWIPVQCLYRKNNGQPRQHSGWDSHGTKTENNRMCILLPQVIQRFRTPWPETQIWEDCKKEIWSEKNLMVKSKVCETFRFNSPKQGEVKSTYCKISKINTHCLWCRNRLPAVFVEGESEVINFS